MNSIRKCIICSVLITNTNSKVLTCGKKECMLERRRSRSYYKEKEHRLSNKERKAEYDYKYLIENKDRITNRIKNYRQKPENKSRRNNIEKIKKETDENYKILTRIRKSFSSMIRRRGLKKSIKTNNLLGKSLIDTKKYLEFMFTTGMTWDNIAIDHIVPLSYFNLTNEKQQKIAFNYRNLQPLFRFDNGSKNNKLPPNYLEIIAEIEKALDEEDNGRNTETC